MVPLGSTARCGALLVLVAGCGSDAALRGKQEDERFEEGDSPPAETTDSAATRDSAVDTGVAACGLDGTPAGPEEVRDECGGLPWLPPADIGDFVVEWSLAGGESYSAPVIARLSDRDGDGDVDADDPPDILTVDLYTGEMWRFAGDGSVAEPIRASTRVGSLAYGDVDQDGVANLLVADARTLEVCALAPDLTVLWCATEVTSPSGGSPLLTDLEGDGDLEIVAVGGILDGATGTFEVALCSGPSVIQPVAADVDGDGVSEVLCGRQLWRADGTSLFDLATPDDLVATTFVDRDVDGTPEILVVDLYANLALLAPDGREIATYAGSPRAVFSAPCVADIDGDGDPEIGVAHGTRFEVYDGDLDPLWTAPISDSSGDASCSAFDFDADGAFEFVYADEGDLYVFHGDGSVALQWADHSSGTAFEYPTIADVDLDGSAEIVVAEAYGNTGVTVLGHAGGGWAPSDPVWPDNLGAGGAVLPDGTMNPTPPSVFRGGGRYHVQEPGVWDAGSGEWVLATELPDLGVAIEDVCADDCDAGPVRVGVSAWNRGPVDTDAVVRLYRNDGKDPMTEIGSAELSLPAGTRGAPLSFETPTEGVFGWVATVTTADGTPDCDDTDDTSRWTHRVCP